MLGVKTLDFDLRTMKWGDVIILMQGRPIQYQPSLRLVV